MRRLWQLQQQRTGGRVHLIYLCAVLQSLTTRAARALAQVGVEWPLRGRTVQRGVLCSVWAAGGHPGRQCGPCRAAAGHVRLRLHTWWGGGVRHDMRVPAARHGGADAPGPRACAGTKQWLSCLQRVGAR